MRLELTSVNIQILALSASLSKRDSQLDNRIIKTERYQFTIDESENFGVRMVDSPMDQYAGSKDMVLLNAEAMAVGWFGHAFFCGVDEVRILDSSYDENASICYVTVEGPVGSEYKRQVVIPEPLLSMMAAGETSCVAGCCGLDAFDIDVNQIRQWSQGEGAGVLEEARGQIEELINSLAPLSGEYNSRRLGFYGTGDEWVRMLTEWKDAVRAALDNNG